MRISRERACVRISRESESGNLLFPMLGTLKVSLKSSAMDIALINKSK